MKQTIPTRHDDLGNPISATSGEAVASFGRAIHELQRYRGDPVATVEAALQADPSLVMGHVLHGYLHLLGTEPAGFPVAQADLAAAQHLPASSREDGHRRALAHLVRSEWRAAGRVLEDIAIDHPRDVLALQVGHLVDFYIGDSRMLRDRIARALPYWSSDLPGYHAVLGMHAFGLEETGLYARAEAAGRRAVELEPQDAWAWHAVAHVLEMQTRRREGIEWLRANPEAWSKDNFFAVHNWWHLAVCHLDLEEIDEVLALFDGPIYGNRSTLVLDLIDASALLWRLYLLGVPVGERWQSVADAWGPVATAGSYAFNDAHAMMAFVGSERPEAAQAVLDAQERALSSPGDNAGLTREVGAPVTRAILAFGQGDYGETVRLLRPVRNQAQRFGGSHAQRDLLDLTLIEAALRDGQRALAAALAAERIDLKPASPAARTLSARTGVVSALAA
ncbi:MAG: tetratricopeptide repeat protein [Chromatiaceae bacterium]|nr:tetratricopeptide repeat protein [Chromatiaceae bacterium]